MSKFELKYDSIYQLMVLVIVDFVEFYLKNVIGAEIIWITI